LDHRFVLFQHNREATIYVGLYAVQLDCNLSENAFVEQKSFKLVMN